VPATDFDILDSIYSLPPEELPGQWVLAADDAGLPSGWKRFTLLDWTLATHPDTKVYRLENKAGVHLGWVMEPIVQTIGIRSIIPDAVVTLPSECANEITENAIEKGLYGRDASGRCDG